MPDATHLLLFVAGGLLLNLTPGPDVLYIVSSALRGGRRAGVIAACGINAGCFVHVFAAALGVGALLAASATAFNLLKWVGAAYLFWTGIKLLQSKPVGWASVSTKVDGRPARVPTPGEVFRGGFLCNVLNPKVAIFFLAFVPQFIASDAEHKALTFIALGVLFNALSLPVNVGWACAAAWLARRETMQRGMHRLDRAAGAMFIAFGLKLALTDNPSR